MTYHIEESVKKEMYGKIASAWKLTKKYLDNLPADEPGITAMANEFSNECKARGNDSFFLALAGAMYEELGLIIDRKEKE